MRLSDDARRCVVFIGHEIRDGETISFEALATGFFLRFENVIYLVTAGHVAHDLADTPYHIRCNLLGGGADLVHLDPLEGPMGSWHFHPDSTVDVAAAIFPYALGENGWDQLCIGGKLQLDDAGVVEHDIGPGDTCYAVGLFNPHQGQLKSVPVVHNGSIAAMPSDELLPIKDWRSPAGSKAVLARAYLIELTNLPGLSGSPVLVRPTIQVTAQRFSVEGTGEQASIKLGGNAAISAPSADVGLLGVWSGSWDGKPQGVLAATVGKDARIPVGLGVVVPTSRLLEMLQSEPVTAERNAFVRAMTSATPETTKESEGGDEAQ